jgi:hypothetical protein
MFSIVGQYQRGSTFVRHVALAREAGAVKKSQRVSVWQMGPPLVVGPQSQQANHNADTLDDLDLVGFIELSTDDIDGMHTWLADIDTERRPASKWHHYAACPHFFWKLDEAGMPLYRRFSCAGLVVECYFSVDILLVSGNSLPQAEVDVLAPVYGEFVKDQRVREKLNIGLDGNGPWPVLLPGYLFHSLARAESDIRGESHSPQSTAEASYPA